MGNMRKVGAWRTFFRHPSIVRRGLVGAMPPNAARTSWLRSCCALCVRVRCSDAVGGQQHLSLPVQTAVPTAHLPTVVPQPPTHSHTQLAHPFRRKKPPTRARVQCEGRSGPPPEVRRAYRSAGPRKRYVRVLRLALKFSRRLLEAGLRVLTPPHQATDAPYVA